MSQRLSKLASLILTVLLIASAVWTAANIWLLIRSPTASFLVQRGSDEIEASVARVLAREATPEKLNQRLEELLLEDPRNWIAIDAVETLAKERDLNLPDNLTARLEAARENDEGFLTVSGKCIACAWDAKTCELSKILICRAPIDLSPIGDVSGVVRGGVAYLRNQQVDQVDVILSVIGLSATVLVPFSGGTSASIKAGTGFAKLAKSMERLPAGATKPLERAFRDGVDWAGVSSVRDLGGLNALIRPRVLSEAASGLSDAGRLVDAAGILPALHLMKYADTPGDLKAMANASEALGSRVVGAIEVLGKSRFLRAVRRWSDEMWNVAVGLIATFAALVTTLMSWVSSFVLRRLRRATQT